MEILLKGTWGLKVGEMACNRWVQLSDRLRIATVEVPLSETLNLHPVELLSANRSLREACPE